MDFNAYQALRERAAWIDLSGRGKIRATGDDRVRLLHAMCTNHIEHLQPGTGCYVFFLNAQGRILGDGNIFAMPDHLLIDTEPEAKQRIFEHLDKFIIADDVVLHDFTAATATISVEGPAAERILNGLGAVPAHTPCSLVEWGHWQVARWSYTGGPGYAVYVPTEDKEKLIERLTDAGVHQADMEAAEAVRIENGRPRYGVDFSEANIPQETQQMQAIHFSKGCYLGQEIVERVRSRGHVNRQLTPVVVESQTPPPSGTKISDGQKEVGEILSSAFSACRQKAVAFALIRAEALQPSVQLTIGSVPVTPTKPPAPSEER